MNPNELNVHLLTLAAKGHAYDQAVLQRELQKRDARIAELEAQLANIKKAAAPAEGGNG
jgi:hypothetical protein